jgi:hypothetical protein
MVKPSLPKVLGAEKIGQMIKMAKKKKINRKGHNK